MKVLHVMESTIGGTRRHVRDVARGQKDLGLDVTLCVSTQRDPPFEQDLVELEARGVRVHRVPMVREIRPLKDLQHAVRIAELLRRERPDVVHTHSSKAGVLGRSASLATGIGARVHTPHTFAFLFEAMFGRAKREFFRAVEKGLSEATQVVIAVSPAEGHLFVSSGVVPQQRVRVVENGIDPDPYLDAERLERTTLGVPEDAPLGAVVGLLNAAKGQDLALRALARPELEGVHLLLAGHGEDEPALRALARELGVADRAHFLGWRDDVPALLATSDFLLLPSRWEGMPYAVLEAMAAAVPVVCTPVPGAVDLVEHGLTGRIATGGDAAALAGEIERLLAVPRELRSQLGLRARARVLERHTARGMARRLAEVYESLV